MVINLLLILLFTVAIGILAFDIVVVLLSYSIYWYEHANTNTKVNTKRFTRKNIQLLFTLIIPEICFNYITLAILPFGLIGNKKLTGNRGETPVLLLNGLFVNQSCWFWFKWQLRRQGFKNIATVNLSSWHNEEALTELLATKVDELRHQLGVNKVHLVGHSMGGMIARNYVQLRGGEDKIDKLICLGSPHQGSKLATFSIDSLGKKLIPNSTFLNKLNSAPIPNNVKLTNIYTNKDNMVLPNSNNHLPWGEALEFEGMGHTSLIFRQPIINATVAALNKMD